MTFPDPDVPFDPTEPFLELGNQPKGQADYVEQNGVVFIWSESNIHYEPILHRASGKRLLPDVLFDRVIVRNGPIPPRPVLGDPVV